MHLAALVVQEPGDCPEHDAWYGCSICTCEEAWHVKVDGIWNDEELEGGVEAFCQFLLDYQEACGQCLETWEGGCC